MEKLSKDSGSEMHVELSPNNPVVYDACRSSLGHETGPDDISGDLDPGPLLGKIEVISRIGEPHDDSRCMQNNVPEDVPMESCSSWIAIDNRWPSAETTAVANYVGTCPRGTGL